LPSSEAETMLFNLLREEYRFLSSLNEAPQGM